MDESRNGEEQQRSVDRGRMREVQYPYFGDVIGNSDDGVKDCLMKILSINLKNVLLPVVFEVDLRKFRNHANSSVGLY